MASEEDMSNVKALIIRCGRVLLIQWQGPRKNPSEPPEKKSSQFWLTLISSFSAIASSVSVIITLSWTHLLFPDLQATIEAPSFGGQPNTSRMSFSFINAGNQSDVIRTLGLLVVYGRQIDGQYCSHLPSAQAVSEITLSSTWSPSGLSDSSLFATYIPFGKLDVDQGNQRHSFVVQPGGAVVASGSFDSQQIYNGLMMNRQSVQEMSDADTAIMCPVIEFSSTDTSTLMAICDGWAQKYYHPNAKPITNKDGSTQNADQDSTFDTDSPMSIKLLPIENSKGCDIHKLQALQRSF